MKTVKTVLMMTLLCLMVVPLTGCRRNRGEVWDDTISCGRHVRRGMYSLGGKQGDSRQVACREEFMNECQTPQLDYVPLTDEDNEDALAMAQSASQESPGDPGSSIPGIDGFKDPSAVADASGVFKNAHFPYNSSLIKDPDSLKTVHNIADYLKSHPDIYVFVEGHCDERGAEAYNLALGSRRSNVVRNMLIKDGIDPNRLFTISYGKERPLAQGHNEDAWRQNRRAQFKLYQR